MKLPTLLLCPARAYSLFSRTALLTAALIVSGWTGIAFAQTGNDYRSPQEIDPTRTGIPGAGSTGQQQGTTPNNPLATQQAFDVLVKELDNLIPGKLEDNPERKKAIEEAVTAFQLRDANRLIEIFTAQESVDPEFPPRDVLLAALSYATQDGKSGRVLLERAGMNHPDDPAVFAAFTRLAINENRTFDALALLNNMSRVIANAQLSESSKDFYDLLYLDGMTDVAMRQQRYSDARSYLTQQRELAPRNPKVLMVSAELEFKEGNLDKSQEYLKTLRSVFPQTRVPETIMASWFQRTGKTDEARKWMNDAAVKYADSPQVQLEVAEWAVNNEDFPAASAAIKVAEENGETPRSQSLKAKIAFAAESYGVAEAHYQELYQKNPNNFDAANMYALSLIENSDTEKQKLALQIANQNFRSLPDNIVAQAALGYVQLRLGNLEQAKSALGRALQSNTVSPEIRFFSAVALRDMNQAESAQSVLQQALNHQGLFLYRSAAQKMLTELNGKLPAPGSSDK